MHKFPSEAPTIGWLVTVYLANGESMMGYWDGLQWWCGVDGQDGDVPIANNFITGWFDQSHEEPQA